MQDRCSLDRRLARLHIVGSYEQNSAGVLDLQWAALTSHDLLSVSGLATLNGNLRMTVVDDFVPDLLATITPITFGSRTGEFTQVVGFLGSGRSASVTYLPNSFNAHRCRVDDE